MRNQFLEFWEKHNLLLILVFSLVLMASLRTFGQSPTDGVKDMIKAYGIKHPDIVYNQLLLESGRLECTDCSWECCNNPFGFLWKGKYLEFDNLEHAVEYYAWWQSELYTDPNENYYDFLTRVGYAKAKNYISTLKKFENESSEKYTANKGA